MLKRVNSSDERVLIGPGIGLDAAAIALNGGVLVIKSDPITFPTPDAARYLVHVNANDVACLGAIPRWMLVTSLLPEGTTTIESVERQFSSLISTCNELGIELVGGHSEITIGIDRPILCGTLLGETNRESLLDLRDARPGDRVLLCNGIAIEGTAILASEAPPDLLSAVPKQVIARAREFSSNPGISVVGAARVLIDAGAEPRGLHDPTEGGLATALDEVASATGCGLLVDEARIDVLPETLEICDALQLDPLGLIASGALLAVVPESTAQLALKALANAGYRAADIGCLTADADDRTLQSKGQRKEIPAFAADEVARFFSELDSSS